MRLILVPHGKESVDGSKSGGQRGEQRIIVAAGRREQPRRRDPGPRSATKARDSGSRSSSIVIAQPLASAMRRASSSKPSETSIIALGMGRERSSGAQAAEPGGGRCRPAGRSRCGPSRSWASRRRASPTVPTSHRTSPGLAAGAVGHGAPARPDRGQAEHARRAGGQARSCRRRAAAGRSSRTPPRCRSRKRSSHSPGAAIVSDSSAPAGVAPFAARSERFTATSFQPTLAGGSVGRKCTPSAMLSWVTTRPSSTRDIVEQPARFRAPWRSGAAVR